MESDSFRSSTPATTERLAPPIMALAWLVLFVPTFVDLWHRWVQWDTAMAHGIPVMGLFLWLLWRSGAWAREPLLPDRFERALAALLLLGVGLLWFLARLVNIQLVEQLLVMAALPAAYLLVFGGRTLLRHRLLLLFPVFALPVWGSLNGLLLDGASLVVGELVRWVGIAANIRGNSIYIPYGHILIADGCSGLRYFVIALTLAYLVAYLNGYREGKLFVALAVAGVLGLLTNWIRIFVLILVGYYTRMESSLMSDHELFGWVLFAVVCLPAIYFAPVVSGKDARAWLSASSESVGPPGVVVALGFMALGPALSWGVQAGFDAADADQKELSGLSVSLPVPVRAPGGGQAESGRGERGVLWRRDLYHRDSLDEKLVPYLPRLFDHGDWLSADETTQVVAGQPLRYMELNRKAGPERVAQLQWFVVGERVTDSRVKAKLLQIPATLQRQNHFAIWTLQATCLRRDCDSARNRLVVQAEKFISRESMP